MNKFDYNRFAKTPDFQTGDEGEKRFQDSAVLSGEALESLRTCSQVRKTLRQQAVLKYKKTTDSESAEAYKVNELLSNVGDMALKRRAAHIIKGLDIKKGDKILDAGCGDGFYLHLITNLGIKVELIGIDNDKNALKSAQNNINQKIIKLILGDLSKKLPFKNNYFDKIILSEVLEHLRYENRALQEIYRVLKPGGFSVITVPNANYPFLWDPINWLLERLFNRYIQKGFFAGIWNQHKRLYTHQKLKVLLDKVKFNIDYMESITWWCLPFNHYLVNFGARLLYGNKLPQSVSAKVSKFQTNPYKPVLISSIFKIVNLIDKLNDNIPMKESGVGIIVKVKK